MTRQNLVLGLLLAAATAGAAPHAHASTWDLIPEASTVSFAGTQTGTAFRGQFRRFDAEITLDPEDLSTAAIRAVIHTSSIASGSPDRDTDAVEFHWFNTAVFPQAVFTSSTVEHLEGNAYVAIGTLDIKGIAQAVDLPFTLDIEGDRAVADGEIRLNRIDYDLGASGEVADDSFVGHEVIVTLHIEASRQN